MNALELLRAHPQAGGRAEEAMARCIDECHRCAAACTACADACLAEEQARQLALCIRLDLDCADICIATARVALRLTGVDDALLKRMLETCAIACELCAAECRQHDHEHCRLCAERCERCAERCREAGQGLLV